jgi:hypothetical protein
MSVRSRSLTECQYTDMMLVIAADHVAAAVGGDAIMLLAIPALWIVGVVAFIAFKFHFR